MCLHLADGQGGQDTEVQGMQVEDDLILEQGRYAKEVVFFLT